MVQHLDSGSNFDTNESTNLDFCNPSQRSVGLPLIAAVSFCNKLKYINDAFWEMANKRTAGSDWTE